MPTKIKLPHNFTPRFYQVPILRARELGVKKIAWVAHRRSGKDKTCLAAIFPPEMFKAVGSYYHLFPEGKQARKVIWDGIGKDGMRYMDHFPKELIEGKPNQTEMKLRLKNGSIWQLCGTNNIDSIVGSNPRGVVFSEYSLMDPLAWRMLRPILAENGGWAIFIFTPRGENHGYEIWNLANQEMEAARAANKFPEWFALMSKASQTGAIPQDVLDQERKEIIHADGNDALYLQEYECSFTVPIAGAFYAAQIMRAYDEGRIGRVSHDPRYLVDTWWDLGVNDRMAIWFTQTMGVSLHVIDYFEWTGQGLPFYAKKLQEKNYNYGKHHAPHDIKQRELTTGRTRLDTAKTLGMEFETVELSSLQDGIDSARALLDKCWFDAVKCADGLNALKNYQHLYDPKRKIYLKEPYHDWSSNGADAFRTCAMGLDIRIEGYKPAKRDAWDPEDEGHADASPEGL